MSKLEILPINFDDVKDCPGDYIGCEICIYGEDCLRMRLNKLIMANREEFKMVKEIREFPDIKNTENNKEDSDMNAENKNTEVKKTEAIDPFMVEDDQSKTEKSKAWEEIFLRCPEFADFIIVFYKEYGEEGLNDLIIMYNPKEKKFELGSKTPAPSSEDKKEEE